MLTFVPYKTFRSVCSTEANTKWTVLPHSLYTPDLAASDFHLFGPVKDSVNDEALLGNTSVAADEGQKFLPGWNTCSCLKMEEDR